MKQLDHTEAYPKLWTTIYTSTVSVLSPRCAVPVQLTSSKRAQYMSFFTADNIGNRKRLFSASDRRCRCHCICREPYYIRESCGNCL